MLIVSTIKSNINHDILRKYLYSSFVSGFSGVSSGHKTNIKTVAILVNTNIGICILFVSHSLVHKRQRKIDIVVIKVHFISLEA